MPALAADLAARPYTKAPPMSLPSMTGADSTLVSTVAGVRAATAGISSPCLSPEGCHDATGGTVGGQVGYRWQSGTWCSASKHRATGLTSSGSNTSLLFPAVNSTKIDAFGLFTGQVGYAWNNVLFYVKGGAAVTDTSITSAPAGRSRPPGETQLGRHGWRRPRIRLSLRTGRPRSSTTTCSCRTRPTTSRRRPAPCRTRPHPPGRRSLHRSREL